MAVGGTPSTLLTDGPDGWIDLNDDRPQDLIVADATAGTISVLLGHSDPPPTTSPVETPTPGPRPLSMTQDASQSGLPRLASRVSLPGGAASEPVAMRLVDRLGDERTHLLVAARGTGEVVDIPISRSGALGAPATVLSGARPVAIHARASLTADLADDVVVADGSGALRLLVASPSRIVDQRRGAANVAADAGVVVWSQRVGAQRYRVRIADRSGVRYLPSSTSRHRLTPRLGRAADGTPVVTYRRCRMRGCTPWVWSVARGRARPLHVPTARGCSATDLALWDGVARLPERLEQDRPLSARRARAVDQRGRSPRTESAAAPPGSATCAASV